MKLLKAGDIVLSSGNSRFARLVRWGQTSPGEERSLVNHAIIVHSGGHPAFARIVESDSVVRYGALSDFHSRDMCYAFRPKNISETVLSTIVNAAYRRIGERYGYPQLFAQLTDTKLFAGKNVARRLFAGPSHRAVCSRLVAEAYGTAGYDFGVPAYAASPDDIFDFCTFRSDKYDGVWSGLPQLTE